MTTLRQEGDTYGTPRALGSHDSRRVLARSSKARVKDARQALRRSSPFPRHPWFLKPPPRYSWGSLLHRLDGKYHAGFLSTRPKLHFQGIFISRPLSHFM